MAKIIITRKSDNVINYIVDTCEIVENGILVTDGNDRYIIAYPDDFNVFPDIETPDTVKPQEYKYTTTGGFVKNPDYVEYVSPEEKVRRLEAALATQQELTDTVILDNLTMQSQIDSLITASLI